MTYEQEIQYAIKAAIVAKLATLGITYATVYGIKLDSLAEGETEAEKETYPVIVVNTSTPVPMGHKSKIIDIAAWVTVIVYLPDDLRKAHFTALTDVVFKVIHETANWTAYQTESNTIDIGSIMINAGEEPGFTGGNLEQVTACTVHANIT